ncbi:recombination protein RecR [Candidatus Kaiserbacteria bacterium CG10_big_fil_rev_8_21_14_0_10_56_12]|uniref:Recombination protein RecR n=1 Tax=Candidatus Kaiserbacteria bacterium CG10_big_fil_rev_8_21_14_0_10_56_12 TaxID=1974611 RepID=A0A2H0UAC9_9BACT|nr:MAG: recombination protein RecR [Candidatus Kaiserbacteria bacterium CG10_big_fil_rev_8_21_14_0_10_56_12]
MDKIDELATALARLPGIGPRQAKRFVFHLLSVPSAERSRLAALIADLGARVHQCPDCRRFYNPASPRLRRAGGTDSEVCNYCSDSRRDDGLLLLVEKDQDLAAIERAGTYKGRYFVLGGVLTLTGKGGIREKELIAILEKRIRNGLKEVVLALSATSEGEHTTDHIRLMLAPYRDLIKTSLLGRGLATGSELEYSDAETLRAALSNRKET